MSEPVEQPLEIDTLARHRYGSPLAAHMKELGIERRPNIQMCVKARSPWYSMWELFSHNEQGPRHLKRKELPPSAMEPEFLSGLKLLIVLAR